MSTLKSAPPTKSGVGPSTVSLPVGPWATVAEFLIERFPNVSRAEWDARIECGDVIDAHGQAVTPRTVYQPHTKIHYYRHLAAETVIPFAANILFQDEFLVVADKPHFLPVMPAGRYVQETLLVRLKRTLDVDTLVPLHRIDRDTAGLVLFSVQQFTRDHYAAMFRERTVTKRYEAIAGWRADLQLPLLHRSRLVESESSMLMTETAGAPNAETAIAALEVRGAYARYALSPVTGKKHQLRVHMASLGIPIQNDRLYPRAAAHADRETTRYDEPLQLLAKSLSFIDPISGHERNFESRLTLLW